MPNLGMGEMVLLLLILVLVFGAKRLPQVGEGIGKAIKGLKRGLQSDDDIEVDSPPSKEQKSLASQSSAQGMAEVQNHASKVIEDAEVKD